MTRKKILILLFALIHLLSIHSIEGDISNKEKIINDINIIVDLIYRSEYSGFSSFLNNQNKTHILEVDVKDTLNSYGEHVEYSIMDQVAVYYHHWGILTVVIDDDLLTRDIKTDAEYAISLFYNLYKIYIDINSGSPSGDRFMLQDMLRMKAYKKTLSFIRTLSWDSNQNEKETYNIKFLEKLDKVFSDEDFYLNYLGIDEYLLHQFASFESILRKSDLTEYDCRRLISSIVELNDYIVASQESTNSYMRRQVIFRKYLSTISNFNEDFYSKLEGQCLPKEFVEMYIRLNRIRRRFFENEFNFIQLATLFDRSRQQI